MTAANSCRWAIVFAIGVFVPKLMQIFSAEELFACGILMSLYLCPAWPVYGSLSATTIILEAFTEDIFINHPCRCRADEEKRTKFLSRMILLLILIVYFVQSRAPYDDDFKSNLSSS